MTISITRLKDTAETFTSYIEEKVKEEFIDNSKILTTKEDIDLLKEDISNVRELVANTKSEISKWLFIFWIGQVAFTFGFILLFLKK